MVYKSRKILATKRNIKIKDQEQKILFPQVLGQKKSDVDLMLALSKTLQKNWEKMRFFRVEYSPSGVVSILVTIKANAGSFIPSFSNILIRMAKIIDQAIVEVEILKYL